MENIKKVVKATVNGEPKEEELVLSVPEHLTEAVEEYGEEVIFKGWLRQYVTDQCNAKRVVMKGGVEKEKRAKMKALLAKILEDPDLLEKVEKKTGISLS